jgi:hypothetical protein
VDGKDGLGLVVEEENEDELELDVEGGNDEDKLGLDDVEREGKAGLRLDNGGSEETKQIYQMKKKIVAE